MSGGAINIIRLVIDLYATVHSNSNRLDLFKSISRQHSLAQLRGE